MSERDRLLQALDIAARYVRLQKAPWSPMVQKDDLKMVEAALSQPHASEQGAAPEACPTCGAPCSTTILMRGGDHGWGTTDKERTTYKYAPHAPAPVQAPQGAETCVCGSPETPNVTHRKDGPCFHEDTHQDIHPAAPVPPLQGAEAVPPVLSVLADWEEKNGTLAAILPSEWQELHEMVTSAAIIQSPRQALFALAKLAAPVQAAPTEPAWRCFQCDEVFTDEASAAEHFGKSQMQVPACTIDIAEYRRMEETHRRHCEEDTDLHREIHGLHCSHRTALMREEEKGYARGLKDGQSIAASGEQAPAPTVEQAIQSLVAALADSKGWMRDYADAIVRDAIDRRGGEQEKATEGAWQPIETAPKSVVFRDGNHAYSPIVLVYAGGEVLRARWWEHGDGSSNFIQDGGRACCPSHWQPLPAAPSSQAAKGDGSHG